MRLGPACGDSADLLKQEKKAVKVVAGTDRLWKEITAEVPNADAFRLVSFTKGKLTIAANSSAALYEMQTRLRTGMLDRMIKFGIGLRTARVVLQTW